ncbi:hypothetical protein EYR36_007791 [Pleurotus pulmonarius]|nr:hypothetical protein EYR36_007791 [Pleurotus pulmonarius]
MPRTVKSDSRARGTGGNQAPHTRSSVLSPTPRATRSSSRVALPPTSTSAHTASHTPRPPTRRSRRRTRKRGPGGAHSSRTTVAGPTPQSFTLNHRAGANIDHTRRTIKKPRLEDFETESENEESIDQVHFESGTQFEDDVSELEHAHEMGALSMLISILNQLSMEPGPSLASQDDVNHSEDTRKRSSFPTIPNDAQDATNTAHSTQPTPCDHRRHGLLKEMPGAPFDEDTWKDWVLTPLELRHSRAPREDAFLDFPLPGPLPTIPCAVRFDIVNRFPAESLCMIGCARSDVSNGWVVTHSKTLLLDMVEARRFVNGLRYKADEIEILGEQTEDALRLQFNYHYTFEDTVFEHPWLQDLQKRYQSTYSLKSTFSEYQNGETLPRGTLTRNGNWNHRIQGELTDEAGFVRISEAWGEDSTWTLDKASNDEVTTPANGYKEVGIEEEREIVGGERSKHPESTQQPSPVRSLTLTIPPSTPPRSFFLISAAPLPNTRDFELLSVPTPKPTMSPSQGLLRIQEAASDVLYEETDACHTDELDLSYPANEPSPRPTQIDSSKTLLLGPQAPPIFPSILPPNALRPGESFIEMRTDQPDIWGFNDAESTVVRIQSAPIEPTRLTPLFTKDPPPHHPIWNETLGRIDRVRTMKKYDGDALRFNSVTHTTDYINLACTASKDWRDDGDLTIGTGVADLCTRMRRESLPPSILDKIEDENAREDLNHRLQEHLHRFSPPDHSHCLLDLTLPDEETDVLTAIRDSYDHPFDVSTANDSFFHLEYRDPLTSHDSAIKNNIWTPHIVRLRRIRLRTSQLIQHIVEYFLRGDYRTLIDALPPDNPIHHYFYHHCTIFRFLRPDVPVILQGFNQYCVHSVVSPGRPIVEQFPFSSENPFITEDEEAFLAYVSKVFELAGQITAANSVRHLRRLEIFMDCDVRILGEAGFLDPTYFFDGYGKRRAISWKISNPIDF